MEATINGVKISYEDQGQGPAVLLVHAFPLSGEMWQQQVFALSRQYRIIVPDMRGFGNSDVPPGPYPMETFADDVAGLLDTLGIEKVVLGGLSMGGYISLAFVRRHAARLRGLILADTRATADTDEGKASRETNAQMVEAQGAGAIADKMVPNMLSPSTPPEQQTYLRSIIERNTPQGIAAALRGMALRPDSSDLLPTIKVPTLVIVGEDDMLSSPDEVRGLHMAIPGSRMVEIGRAGHVANVDNPEAFNRALLGFLQTI